jgi:hypothetical protein
MSPESIGDRDDSDAGLEGDLVPSFLKKWDLETVRDRALELGKSFEPNANIVGRLEVDLNKGAQVFFSVEEVREAVKVGLIPTDWQEEMENLVSETGLNDIGVIPSGAVEAWAKQQNVYELGRSMKMW